jgi:glycosyltransferase involved in cell wall biosynthesis
MIASRPTIMRIITRLAGGGPPVHVTLLNRRLPEQGLSSILVYGDCASAEPNMDYLLAPGDRTFCIPELGPRIAPWSDLVAFFRLWWLMLRLRPRIVHTHTAKAGFLGRLAALFAGIPNVVHTYHGHVLDSYFSPLFNRILRLAERLLGHASQALCTVSPQQAAELSEKFAVAAPEKFHVVPLGLDLCPYLELPAPDFHAPRLTVLWLGRFVPVKNLPLLLDVMAECQRQQLPLNFVLAGEGVERPWVEQQIRQRGLHHVQLLPWQNDIRRVLSAAHLLILTSHREGTPLALIQGLAAGRPFVSTSAGGIVDMIGQPIPHSFLVAPDALAFADQFKALLSDRDRLGNVSNRGREFARDRYSEQRLVQDLANLYHKLLESQPQPAP